MNMVFHRFVALVLGGALVAAVPALAVPKVKPVMPAQNSGVVQQLHQAVRLLSEANHDYDGYRAKAVHNVHKAIHSLEPSHHHPGTLPAAVGTTKGAGNKEEQNTSDQQLKTALQKLQAALPVLQGLPGKHHQQAAADVANAINDLNTALKIR